MPSLPTLTSTLLSTLGAFTLASPLLTNDISPAGPALEARDEWQITPSSLLCLYMTNEPNWGGEGVNLCDVGGTCGTKLPDGLTANVSSAGPEAGITCFLFSEQNCAGDRSAPLVNPGYSDLSAIGFDKKAQSWECWKWCGWMGTSSASSSSLMTSASTVGALLARLVSITTTVDGSAQTAATTPGLPSVLSMASESAISTSQAAVFETSMTTIVVTHTYADGSTTVISSALVIPIAVSSSGPDNAGVAASVTMTEGQTLVGPTPFSTPEAASQAGLSITTTLSATDSASTAAGVSITTTQDASSPVPTLTGEGVTVPLPSVSTSDPESSLSDAAVPESEGWTSLVTLTGVDATLTVTATGRPVASPTS